MIFLLSMIIHDFLLQVMDNEMSRLTLDLLTLNHSVIKYSDWTGLISCSILMETSRTKFEVSTVIVNN